ncbi:Uma2 family endonuclease [Methylomarinum vadi]|uniref:Uma2 family endonuclease n=1 Tax=Methylomarinum vadi TaxID=438855 RepID=UPI0004DF2BCF|nr:Uma2 family endonuclease [Methylomarinum vadi]
MTPSTAPLRKHLTDLEEWHKMGESGIFPPDSHLELINGEIVEMSPIGSNHAGHLKRLNRLLNTLLKKEAIVSIQDPLQLGDFSEPEPDLMLLKPNPDFYCSRHPQAGDVLLLIEVADSSLEYDQTHKLRLYALHNVQEYWLLNLNDSCLEVYRRPRGETYEEKTTLRDGDTINPSLLPDIAIQVAAIL